MHGSAGALDRSQDASPVTGTVDVAVPVDVLWDCFRRANLWPRWNDCFTWVRNQDLVAGERLVWVFEPIRPAYLYRMPAIAGIVEVELAAKATWEVTALPGMYARHTYFLTDLGDGRTRFGSWEKAMGPGFRLTERFWTAHFTFVLEESLEGAQRLEGIYRSRGTLDEAAL